MPSLRHAAIWVFLVANLLATAHFAQGLRSHDAKGPMQANAAEISQYPVKAPALNLTNRRIRCKRAMDYKQHQCGLLDVPLDWHDPSHGIGRVYYARYPASAEVRKGTIFIDTGAPFAASGAWTPQEWLAMRGEALHNLTGGEYDFVVWDARGKGVHNLTIPGPPRCFHDALERDRFHIYLDAEWTAHLIRKPGLFRDAPDSVEVEKWHYVQSKVVEHCVAQQRPEMLRNMGMTATTRDLVAMADAFDGPGSPVNFWGMGYGSVVGAHLLRMFPERAGRVILESPADLLHYSSWSDYDAWRDEIAYANATFAGSARECADGPRGCQIAPYDGPHADVIADYMRVSLWLTRASLLGTRNRNTVQENLANPDLKGLFDAIGRRGANTSAYTAANITDTIAALSNVYKYADESLGLGVMPILCGDKVLEHNPTTATRHARAMMNSLIRDKAGVPMLGTHAYPPLHYMCHLWPVRAAERYPAFNFDRRGEMPPVTPAQPFLVLQGEKNPLSAPKNLRQIVYGVHHGIPLFAHSPCMTRVITKYLINGTLPIYIRCRGDVSEEAGENWLEAERAAARLSWLNAEWSCTVRGLALAASSAMTLLVVVGVLDAIRRRKMRGGGEAQSDANPKASGLK